MIYFIWPSPHPLLFGRGGSETYTVGQARELIRRGIACTIVTIHANARDSYKAFPDVPFLHITQDKLAKLDGTLIFVSHPLAVRTKRLSYIILHVPPDALDNDYTQKICIETAKDKILIATSEMASRLWSQYLNRPVATVYPFASREFGVVKRNDPAKPTILFAGRLVPQKGVYTLFNALHFSLMQENYNFIATAASASTKDGKVIRSLLQAHPYIQLVGARNSPLSMAKLLAKCTMLVMPTSAQIFIETFGMLSIEAQHTGCRVVASDQGGLPETDIGGLTLVPPDDPVALARAIISTAKLGALSNKERGNARKHFTLTQSVDSLLKVVGQ